MFQQTLDKELTFLLREPGQRAAARASTGDSSSGSGTQPDQAVAFLRAFALRVAGLSPIESPADPRLPFGRQPVHHRLECGRHHRPPTGRRTRSQSCHQTSLPMSCPNMVPKTYVVRKSNPPSKVCGKVGLGFLQDARNRRRGEGTGWGRPGGGAEERTSLASETATPPQLNMPFRSLSIRNRW